MNKNLIFIDSTIWVNALIKNQDNEQKHEIAKNLIKEPNNIIVSTQVINEVNYIFLKNIKFFEKYSANLINSFYFNYRVVNLNKEILLKASELRNYYNFSFFDSIAIATALINNCSLMYSEFFEEELIVDAKLKIINPFAKYE
ncbi:MAG TPA: PIN domain-containing protein [Ignavibacteriales bacterium]|nr:PIN domain-containing protein [Ignavibacteriales bacterium]HOL81010.1 PIN domain-containing protein [Ignavibacteriales bacterium]HOM64746.1 PIN domain-containing protein [Ignavibacteriales bacterium]HPD66722.1 PIN domain-containing protein [Ignavibacteriales bacterium]HPP32790.1 PIN domain-containing protein [Ignavibacteriales bacterium]